MHGKTKHLVPQLIIDVTSKNPCLHKKVDDQDGLLECEDCGVTNYENGY